ncbi:MAG: DUF1232 domain-containing protein [Phycisphaerales bacterium]|nr:DUF1232 domain-containing protein [Phycisphaerales bacterium]
MLFKILITLLGVAYVISPMDVIPDFFLLIGWVDDAAVVTYLVRMWSRPAKNTPAHLEG